MLSCVAKLEIFPRRKREEACNLTHEIKIDLKRNCVVQRVSNLLRVQSICSPLYNTILSTSSSPVLVSPKVEGSGVT